MKHNLIKTDNYLLVFDKLSEIKEGDWYKTPLGIYSQFNGTEKLPIGTRRVASHAPLNGAPYLDGVDVLPFMDNGEKHEYTTEDILDAWELGAKEGLPLTRKKKEDLFDFLHQPKLPIAFESVDIDVHEDTGLHLKKVGTEPDKITNSEGRIEWVGKYIYE